MGNLPGEFGAGSGLPELRVEPKQGAFGDEILTSPDLMKLARADARGRAIPTTEAGRARCAAHLLVQANRSAAAVAASGESELISGRLEEARYLSEQAGLLMGGGASGASGVDCPAKIAEVPDVMGAPIEKSAIRAKQAERLLKNTRAYTQLFTRARTQVDDYHAARSQLTEAETAVDQAKQRADEAKLEVERLKQEPAPPTNLTDEPAPAEPDAADDALLAEALAALKESEKALGDAELLRDEQGEPMSRSVRPHPICGVVALLSLALAGCVAQGVHHEYCRAEACNSVIAGNQRSVERDPENATSWYFLGAGYVGQERWAEAAEPFQRVLASPTASSEERAGAHYYTGLLLQRGQAYGEALASYDRAIETLRGSDWEIWSHYGKGKCYSELGQLREAIAAYRKHLAFETTHPQHMREADRYERLAVSYRALGRLDAALAALTPSRAEEHPRARGAAARHGRAKATMWSPPCVPARSMPPAAITTSWRPSDGYVIGVAWPPAGSRPFQSSAPVSRSYARR